jgi:hypothetical protein
MIEMFVVNNYFFLILRSIVESEPLSIKKLNIFGQCPNFFWEIIKNFFEQKLKIFNCPI